METIFTISVLNSAGIWFCNKATSTLLQLPTSRLRHTTHHPSCWYHEVRLKLNLTRCAYSTPFIVDIPNNKRPHCPQGKSPRNPLNSGIGGPQSRPSRLRKEINLLNLSWLEPRIIRPAALPLYRRHPGSHTQIQACNDNKKAGQAAQKFNLFELDIGRSVYHFLQYIYIPTRYTM